MRIILFISCLIIGFSMQSAKAESWWDRVQGAMDSDSGRLVIEELSQSNSSTSNLSNTDISKGLREALRIGSERVVNNLGQTNGFHSDPKIRIPLPSSIGRVDQALSAIGMNSLTEDLELRLNRAAEAATPRAKELFISAIQSMTIEDARKILSGSDNAATQYLRKAMGPQLSQDMQPLVSQALSEAGAIRVYDQVMSNYDNIPFMPDVKANLNDYVVEKAMDGIFYYIGQEEAAIRSNPAKFGSDILKTVFQ